MPDVVAFGAALGHPFREPRFATEALTHASLVNEPAGKGRTANTRQEYLGDAVVELAVRSILVNRFPHAKPGDLDGAKQLIVANDRLANVVRRLGLAKFLERGGSRPPDSDVVLAQLLEASMAAVYLDAGFDDARTLIERHLEIPRTSDELVSLTWSKG